MREFLEREEHIKSSGSMQPTFSCCRHVFLALNEVLDLLAYLLEPAQDLLVSISEIEDGIWYASLLAELSHEDLNFPEVVSGHSWEQMMHCLELKATVNKVEPGWAVDVHGGSQLSLGERLHLAKIRGRHAPV